MTTEVDEVPFQLLHLELIQTILSKTARPDRNKALCDVESIGFQLDIV